ncbi:hypothetical protein FQN60_002576, partial [Etheostoma spectabile]
CKGEDRVIQPPGDVITTEGETLTLGCTFETTASYSYLFWYKQEENSSPKFMLSVYSGAKDAEDIPKGRIYSTVKDKTVPLKISSAKLSDSAVYYCALQPTGLLICVSVSEKSHKMALVSHQKTKQQVPSTPPTGESCQHLRDCDLKARHAAAASFLLLLLLLLFNLMRILLLTSCPRRGSCGPEDIWVRVLATEREPGSAKEVYTGPKGRVEVVFHVPGTWCPPASEQLSVPPGYLETYV